MLKSQYTNLNYINTQTHVFSTTHFQFADITLNYAISKLLLITSKLSICQSMEIFIKSVSVFVWKLIINFYQSFSLSDGIKYVKCILFATRAIFKCLRFVYFKNIQKKKVKDTRDEKKNSSICGELGDLRTKFRLNEPSHLINLNLFWTMEFFFSSLEM